jgi:hypothetical protein
LVGFLCQNHQSNFLRLPTPCDPGPSTIHHFIHAESTKIKPLHCSFTMGAFGVSFRWYYLSRFLLPFQTVDIVKFNRIGQFLPEHPRFIVCRGSMDMLSFH